MTMHFLQHVSFEGPGYMLQLFGQNNYTITRTRLWEEAKFPSVDEFDVLVILGGPMCVYDDHQYDWLRKEKVFIQDAIEAQRKIIGICLGAQLIACVLETNIYTNRQKEIGWFPIRFSPSFSQWLNADMPDEAMVFHWHGDKFDIPYGGENHAFSEACNHQLFTYGQNIIGLQFHLEVTGNTIEQMVEGGQRELTEAAYIQSPATIRSGNEYIAGCNDLMSKILCNWLTKGN